MAIDLGKQAGDGADAIRERVDTVLRDATTTLEHLDLGRAISEARVRAETEALRDALIGSVSHQLRTPLVSILGAATVISRAPGNRGDPRLASLADILRDEVDRLNNDVQDLLDAALISSKGVRWIPSGSSLPTSSMRRSTGGNACSQATELDTAGIPSELPFIYVDPILLEQALGQIIDNAVKYSQPGSTVTVAARAMDVSVVLSVKDEGVGLVGDERTRLWERFFRGERHASNVSRIGSRTLDRQSLRHRERR